MPLLIAQSVSRFQTALGAFYRRMAVQHGASVAITATAHKLSRIVYHMLKHPSPYHDPGIAHYSEQQRRLQRQAHKLGLRLVSEPQPAVS